MQVFTNKIMEMLIVPRNNFTRTSPPPLQTNTFIQFIICQLPMYCVNAVTTAT